jgi:hypothetical protein
MDPSPMLAAVNVSVLDAASSMILVLICAPTKAPFACVSTDDHPPGLFGVPIHPPKHATKTFAACDNAPVAGVVIDVPPETV